MAVNSYDVGDVVRINGSFDNGTVAVPNPVDPTTVALTIKPPSGASTTYVYGTDVALERTATGVYRLDLAITTAGTYWYRWVSTGTAAAAEEGRFFIRPIAVSA